MTGYKREKIKAEILAEMGGDVNALILSQVETYLDTMDRVEDLHERARAIAGDPKKARTYIAYSAEARHQERAARDVLAFLGITGGAKGKSRRRPIPPL